MVGTRTALTATAPAPAPAPTAGPAAPPQAPTGRGGGGGGGGDRAEGNFQLRRNLIEAQADGKAMISHFQFPELVLQNDRHLVREALAQMLWNGNTRRAGFEGNVEMMLPG